MRTKKNKLLKRGRAVALAAVLFCTLIFGTMAVVPPIRAEAAPINGLPINQKLQTISVSEIAHTAWIPWGVRPLFCRVFRRGLAECV